MVLHIDGIPKAQPRPKAFLRGKRAGVYDPGTADGWKQIVWFTARQGRPETPHEGAVEVRMEFRLPRPKRLMRAKDADGQVPHTAKPDADNLAKAVLDVLTSVGYYRDDAQVCLLSVSKVYHAKDAAPGALVEVVER